MKNQTKISLEQISIQSFVTNLSSEDKRTVDGGANRDVIPNNGATYPNNNCYYGTFIICIVPATGMQCPLPVGP